MQKINPQAEELNSIIDTVNPSILSMLSTKGKRIFFPAKGILQQAADAKGTDINATIGMAFEDDGTPMILSKTAANIKFPAEKIVPYAPSIGLPELREEWKRQILAKNPSLNSEISNPVVTSGLTHGLSLAGYLFLDQDDEVLCPDKFWGNYKLVFEYAYGCQLKYFNLFQAGSIDFEPFEKAVTSPTRTGKKVIVLNFPNNPSGYTPTTEEFTRIVNVIESASHKQKIVVLLDDAYFGLFFENNAHTESLFAILAGLNKNVLAIKLDGVTKEDFAWGVRVGFITYGSKDMSAEAYKALENKTAGAIRGNISSSSRLSQQIVLDTMKSDSYEKDKSAKFEILKSRYKEVRRVLIDAKYSKYFKALPYNSGYFMCIELKNELDADSIRKDLLENYSIGVIAIGSNLLRIAYSSIPKSSIYKIFEGIYEACKGQN